MPARTFTIQENQNVWDNYYNKKLGDWDKIHKKVLENATYSDEERVKHHKKCYGEMSLENTTPYRFERRKQRQTISQYKPVLLELDEFLNKPFGDITLRDYEMFKCVTEKKNKLMHVQGFYIYCITNGFIMVKDKEFIKNLVPDLYKPLMRFL